MKIAWEQGRWMPAFTKGGAMGVVDGSPVYAGGMTFPWRETELCWFWDHDRKDWFPVEPNLSLGRAYTQGTTLKDGMVIIGGRKATPKGTISLNDSWWLCRDDGQFYWTQLPDMNYPRAVCSIGVSDSKVLVVGGGEWERSQGGAFATRHLTNYEILDIDDVPKGWQDKGKQPFASLSGSAFASIGDSAYIFGGYECWTEDNKRKIQNYATVWRYDFDKDIWTQLSDLPFILHGMSAVPYGKHIIIMGGAIKLELMGTDTHYHTFPVIDKGQKSQRMVGDYSDLVLVYDTETDSYELMQNRLPIGNADNRATIIDKTIYVAGGETVDPILSNTSNAFLIGTIID